MVKNDTFELLWWDGVSQANAHGRVRKKISRNNLSSRNSTDGGNPTAPVDPRNNSSQKPMTASTISRLVVLRLD
jgi:hypothetical protein